MQPLAAAASLKMEVRGSQPDRRSMSLNPYCAGVQLALAIFEYSLKTPFPENIDIITAKAKKTTIQASNIITRLTKNEITVNNAVCAFFDTTSSLKTRYRTRFISFTAR